MRAKHDNEDKIVSRLLDPPKGVVVKGDLNAGAKKKLIERKIEIKVKKAIAEK